MLIGSLLSVCRTFVRRVDGGVGACLFINCLRVVLHSIAAWDMLECNMRVVSVHRTFSHTVLYY